MRRKLELLGVTWTRKIIIKLIIGALKCSEVFAIFQWAKM